MLQPAATVPQPADLPAELLAKPLALVGVAGLDAANNATHRTLWELLAPGRRAQSAPVHFALYSTAHDFPPAKPRRNSYDWYLPRGILKRNWMRKHLLELPAVMVVFFDLDWNDAHWNERVAECASRVHSMRAALEGRDTHIVVVLIQNVQPIPSNEDALAADRAIQLCSNCDLSSTSLFVLPHGDHLQGYVARLENAFYDLAKGYYANAIKVVKSHKEHLNKNNHQYLLIRHQFKVAYLYEMMQEPGLAHKHYTHAYNHLAEVRIVDTNALEIRTVAGFLNYKLCRLFFALGRPRDAIQHFRSHCELFKQRTGFQELAFEHCAWLSEQYALFGDVFDEAVKLGLPAVQTQHPGIYYEQAARWAAARKLSCLELCRDVAAHPFPDPMDGPPPEFFGQRPWRPGKADPPDPRVETDGIRAVQFAEKTFAHSQAVVSLLGLAMAQFKAHRCPRTRRRLAVQMADEYCSAQDYGKALTLLTHVLYDFRRDGWPALLSEVLAKALRCAYLTASLQDYVALALEVLGSKIVAEDKRKVYENLQRILKRQMPYGDPRLPHDVLQSAIIVWRPVFGGAEPLDLRVDLTQAPHCALASRARFLAASYQVDRRVKLEVHLKNACLFPLALAGLSVDVACQGRVRELDVCGGGWVQLQQGEGRSFGCEFAADPADINQRMEICGITALLGTKSECLVRARLSPGGTADVPAPFQRPNPSSATCQVVARRSMLKVDVEHCAPALLGEWYEMRVLVENDERFSLNDFRIEADLVAAAAGGDGGADDAAVELALEAGGAPRRPPVRLRAPEFLPQKGRIAAGVFLRSHRPAERRVEVRITYSLNKDVPVASIRSEVVGLEFVQPFEVRTRFVSASLMEDVQRFHQGEVFGVMPTVTCTSPHAIEIESGSIEFTPTAIRAVQTEGGLRDVVLGRDEAASDLFLAACDGHGDEQHVPVGHYTVAWRRRRQPGGGTTTTTTTRVSVGGAPCERLPLAVRLSAPAHGLVRTPMVVVYEIANRSRRPIELEVGMEATEAFMFAGYRQRTLSVLPLSTQRLRYNLYPLLAGSVALPRLTLAVAGDGAEGPALRPDRLGRLVERALPAHLYVMPQLKGAPVVAPEVVQLAI